MTNVLAVALDADLGARIAAIPGHQVVAIRRDNFAQVRPEVPFYPDIILVGTGTEGLTPDQGIRYAQRVLAEHATMNVVLIAEPFDDLVREASEAGIRGVVSSSVTDWDLADLIEQAGSPAAPAPADSAIDPPIEPGDSTSAEVVPEGPASAGTSGGRHQVVVVASPKGGVGKTTTAVSVAALLAEDAPGEVVLLDLDLQFGDVASVVDLEAEFSVADALNSGASDSMLLRTLLVPHPANFYVLCGADHPAAVGTVSGDQVRKLVRQFSNDFRYVVVDTSAGMQEETLASLEEATDVVFVGTLDVATLRNLRKEVNVLAELGLLPERRHVVMNRTDRLSGLTQADAANIVGLPIDAMVPVSPNVPLAANHGVLAVQEKRKNKVRRPLRQFVQNISDSTRRPGRHR